MALPGGTSNLRLCGRNKPNTPIRTVSADAKRPANTSDAKTSKIFFVLNRGSLPKTFQHAPCDRRRLGAGHSVDTYHEQEPWMVFRKHCDHEAVAGSAILVRTNCRAGLNQRAAVFQRAVNFQSRSFLAGFRHPGQDFAHAWLQTAAVQFQVSSRHTQGRDQPIITESKERGTRES